LKIIEGFCPVYGYVIHFVFRGQVDLEQQAYATTSEYDSFVWAATHLVSRGKQN
jgi:hypothetical protein